MRGLELESEHILGGIGGESGDERAIAAFAKRRVLRGGDRAHVVCQQPRSGADLCGAGRPAEA